MNQTSDEYLQWETPYQAFRFYMDLYGWGGLEGGVDDFYFYKRPDKQLIDAIVSASGFLSHSENTFF